MKKILLVALLLFARTSFAQVGALAPSIYPVFNNTNGITPVANGFVCTTASGGTTPLATYLDYANTMANQNPIRLNQSGRAVNGSTLVPIFLGATQYRFTLYAAGSSNTCNGTSVGAVVWQMDNVYDIGLLLAAGLINIISPNINNIRYCNDFAGATAGAKIAACIADLPSTGGIADARGIEGAQTVSAAISLAKPVNLLLGAATYTFSGSGAITISSCGASLEGIGNGATFLKPDSAYTGTFITVQAASCINGFGQNYGVRLEHFKILDGTGGFDGTGRTANCDGILLRDTDYMHVEDVRVEFLKGTGLRLRNVRESTFINDYVLMGGDGPNGKPSVWIGNAASETQTDDSNGDGFYDLRIGYATAVGLLISTANATSIANLAVARNLEFHNIEIEGQAVNNSTGMLQAPNNYDLVQLGNTDSVRFYGGAIGNWLTTDSSVAGVHVGTVSAHPIANTVEFYGTNFFGASSQTYSSCTPSCGMALNIDYINTFEMHGGRVISGDKHWGTIKVTANAVRVYIDPMTRVEQESDPTNANGAGINGTLTGISGLITPVGCSINTTCTGSEQIQYNQNLVPLGTVGNTATGSLTIPSTGTATLVQGDSSSVFLSIRSTVGGGHTVAVDSDNFQIGNAASGAIYRCTMAGTLRVGQLTTVSGDCGASTDTGLRTK